MTNNWRAAGDKIIDNRVRENIDKLGLLSQTHKVILSKNKSQCQTKFLSLTLN